MPLPVLIVGDVHGDLQRLFAALQPYPPDRWRTIFLGDLVDGGPFGVGALRYARDRPNTSVLLGNHEVAMLRALRDPSTIGYWIAIGGQPHDLKELERDPDLQRWLRGLPLLLSLGDGTLVQHSDNDNYGALVEVRGGRVVAEANDMGRLLLDNGREDLLWDAMSPFGLFRRQPRRLDAWLQRTGARRVVHGHSRHRARGPDVYHGGRAICYDGGLSRYYGGHSAGRGGSVSGSVAPLPPWQDGRH